MRQRPLSRSLIALAAAYLVALQALLLPLSLPATAAPGSLCVTSSDHPVPAGHDQDCPCAAGCGMACHAPAHHLLGPAAAGATIAATHPAVVALLSPAQITADPVSLARGRPLPRGPPPA